MKKLLISSLLFCLTTMMFATHNVYVIHGYGGFGLQMKLICKAVEKAGYPSINFTYHSFSKDIDSVGHELFLQIQKEAPDTVSFITHSMGALVVRSMYNYIGTAHFPYIHRFIMIAPPNKGTPVADFCNSFEFIKPIAGPNIKNLTTNPLTGSERLPVPTCEVGLILGITGYKTGINPFLSGDNDGIILPERAKLGIEKDLAFVKSAHPFLPLNKKVIKLTVDFLKTGKFG